MTGPRLGIFGGSFDPPHMAHTMAVLWALESGEVDRVIVVPVAQHAFGKRPAAPFHHRLEMCRLAMVLFADRVEVNAIESQREGPSYMVDTLRELARQHPAATFRLLAGSDVAGEIPQWREGTEVLRLAPLLEIPRPRPGDPAGRFTLPDISSTATREALRSRGDAGYLLSHTVRSYIREQRLYRFQEGATP